MEALTNDQLKFLEILAAALKGEQFKGALTENIDSLRQIAAKQNMWPLILDCVSGQLKEHPRYNKYYSEALRAVTRQLKQEYRLNEICEALSNAGIPHIVLKGVSCKRYYPNPQSRTSGDEDILIPWEKYPATDKLLTSLGFQCEDAFTPQQAREEREAHYRAGDNSLYLEVHLNAVGRENKRNRRLNEYFDDAFSHTEQAAFDEYTFYVLEPTWQLMHLFSHFYRHFYEQGAGIRQMVDILMCIRKDGERIRWEKIERFLRESHTEKLFAAMLQTGRHYLKMELIVPDKLQKKTDPVPLLYDMFEGGAFGDAREERKYMEIVSSEVDSGKAAMAEALFPSRIKLSYRYPKLYEKPFLYPVYIVRRWVDLISEYGGNKRKLELVQKGLKQGKDRKRMLKFYR